MIKVKLVVPQKNYIKNAVQYFREQLASEAKEKIGDKTVEFHFEEVVIPAENIKETKFEADVIISRGLMSKLIKEHHKEIPVVDIPVQGVDLIRCLVDVRNKFGKKKVAVIGAMNMIFGVEGLEEVVDLPIKKYIMNDISESQHIVERAKKERCEVVVSGLSTCEYAKTLGIETMLVETGIASLNHALEEAKRLAIVSIKEQEKSKRFQMILDHAYEGVIAIDLNQNISMFNASALEILSIPEENVIGKPIKSVLRPGSLLNLLLDPRDYIEDIISYRTVQLSIKKIAVELRGKKVGDMVAFQDVTGIQKIEGEIRKKIYLRGHIAKHYFHDIIHQSEVVKRTIEIAKSYSVVDSNILIIGETGTGKEMYSQSIHNHSFRKNKPFVAINCAALPESLLESELFGYAEGAFTGAMKGGKQGIFELAHQGTLFLDEIGEISPRLQSRLLRVLQEREVMRIGDDKVIPVDVRIIAATNKNLLEMVKNNEFREDLYYRLSVLDLYLPSLRDYKEDISLLVKHFVSSFSKDNPVKITEAAMKRLQRERWEGNIRQLQNFCERLSVLNRGKKVDVNDVEKYLPQSNAFHRDKGHVYLMTEEKNKENFSFSKEVNNVRKSEPMLKSELERIITALENNHFHREKAAMELGMSRATLWRKIKKYKLDIR